MLETERNTLLIEDAALRRQNMLTLQTRFPRIAVQPVIEKNVGGENGERMS